MRIRILFSILPFLVSNAYSVNRRAGQSEPSKDLVLVSTDLVKIVPPALASSSDSYQFPKSIPGTHTISNYGLYIEDIKAFDKIGAEMKLVPDRLQYRCCRRSRKRA